MAKVQSVSETMLIDVAKDRSCLIVASEKREKHALENKRAFISHKGGK